jgi:hypothetical protein
VCGKTEERREWKIWWKKDRAVELKEHIHTVNDVLFHFATINCLSSLPMQACARACACILVLNTRKKKDKENKWKKNLAVQLQQNKILGATFTHHLTCPPSSHTHRNTYGIHVNIPNNMVSRTLKTYSLPAWNRVLSFVRDSNVYCLVMIVFCVDHSNLWYTAITSSSVTCSDVKEKQ